MSAPHRQYVLLRIRLGFYSSKIQPRPGYSWPLENDSYASALGAPRDDSLRSGGELSLCPIV